MTARPTWLDRAAELRPFAGIADIGPHFTLTDLEPVGAAPIMAPQGRFPPLSHVVRLSLTQRHPQDEIREQLARQLDAFEREYAERLGLASLFDRFLQCPGSRMLIMCHPGRSDSELRRIDSLTSQRDAELASVERRVAPAPG
jgi:predicted glycoside hydrolase/deacetylase ChbG (UPF0249 family)